MDLKRKDAIRKLEIEENLKKGVGRLRRWREEINSIRGYASIFANVLNREHERRGRPEVFVLDRLKRVFEYLPSKVLTKKSKKINLTTQFRTYLKRYGWKIRVNHVRGYFEVEKLF